MEGYVKCVERYCELANKTTQQLYKVSTPCLDDHHFKKELKSVGELSKVCSQTVRKCLYLARIGRPDILWSVNKLPRSITKWTKQSLWQNIFSFDLLHSSHIWKQTILWCGNKTCQCRLGLFQVSDFAWDLEDSQSTSGGTLCVFGSHTFVPISCMCKKQTSVSHSSREAGKILSMQVYAWIGFQLLIFGGWSITFRTEPNRMDPRESHGVTQEREDRART